MLTPPPKSILLFHVSSNGRHTLARYLERLPEPVSIRYMLPSHWIAIHFRESEIEHIKCVAVLADAHGEVTPCDISRDDTLRMYVLDIVGSRSYDLINRSPRLSYSALRSFSVFCF